MTDENYYRTLLWRYRQFRIIRATVNWEFTYNYAIEIAISVMREHHKPDNKTLHVSREYAMNKTRESLSSKKYAYPKRKDTVKFNEAIDKCMTTLREFYYEQEIKT